MDMDNKMVCKCPHHKVVPVCIALIGLAFLLMQWNILTATFVGLAWPILLIVIGLTKTFSNKCKCC